MHGGESGTLLGLPGLVLCVALTVTTSAALADLPLTVEDLITDKGKTKLEISLAYANSDRQGISVGDPIVVQTGPTSFVTLPTSFGESYGNSDSLVGTLGLRYGLTAKTEIFARGSYLNADQRTSGLSGTSTSNESRFADAWAGLNYKFKNDDATPAVLGFAEIALYERHQESSSSIKSALFGLTTYKAIDPVVFSLTAAYRFNQSRNDGNIDFRPGNLLLLNPGAAFAVNDRVTLSTGVQWTNRQPDAVNGEVLGFTHTSTDLLLGVGYGIAKGNTLNVTFKANASGRNGADLRFNWLRTL